jgi:hypothetical protein
MEAIVVAGLLFLVFLLLKLYGRIVEGRQGGEAVADQLPGIEFALEPSNSTSRAMVRFSVAFGLVGVLFATALFVAGEPSAPYIGASAVAMGTVLAWTFRRSFAGTVELRRDALVVHLRQVVQVCPWSDVASVGVANWDGAPRFERWFVAVTGSDVHEPFVEVRLRRQLRASVFGSEQGPHIFGVPFGQRRVRVFVRNPETVAEMAQGYLMEGVRA